MARVQVLKLSRLETGLEQWPPAAQHSHCFYTSSTQTCRLTQTLTTGIEQQKKHLLLVTALQRSVWRTSPEALKDSDWVVGGHGCPSVTFPF